MRWPSIRKAGTRRDAAEPTTSADAPHTRVHTAAHTATHTDTGAGSGPSVGVGSRPRTDWAHLAPIVTATAPTPSLTFHGDRFGRSVAGARSMVAAPRTPPRHLAPVGLVLDLAHVDAVTAAPPPIVPDPAVAAAAVAAPPVHRKPVAAPRPATPLTTSTWDVDLPVIEPRHRPKVSPVPDQPTAWDIDRGFHTGDDVSADPDDAPRMRIVRRRTDDAPTDVPTDAPADAAGAEVDAATTVVERGRADPLPAGHRPPPRHRAGAVRPRRDRP